MDETMDICFDNYAQQQTPKLKEGLEHYQSFHFYDSQKEYHEYDLKNQVDFYQPTPKLLRSLGQFSIQNLELMTLFNQLDLNRDVRRYDIPYKLDNRFR